MRYCGLFTLCFTVLSLVFGACGKREDVQTVSTYSFTNTLKESVTLNVYDSREDYFACGKIYKTLEIKPGAITEIPLQALRAYWLDWYSKDFSYNNWASPSSIGANSSSLPTPELTVAAVDDQLYIKAFGRDTSRAILLNGTNSSSVWKITIASEPALNGTHTFIFKKDFSGQYTFTDAGGMMNIIPISYSVYNYTDWEEEASDFRVIVYNPQVAEFASLDFYRNGGSSFSGGRDSLMATFRGFNDRYWAVRQ